MQWFPLARLVAGQGEFFLSGSVIDVKLQYVKILTSGLLPPFEMKFPSTYFTTSCFLHPVSLLSSVDIFVFE